MILIVEGRYSLSAFQNLQDTVDMLRRDNWMDKAVIGAHMISLSHGAAHSVTSVNARRLDTHRA